MELEGIDRFCSKRRNRICSYEWMGGVWNWRIKCGGVREKGLWEVMLEEICVFFVKDFILFILVRECVKY